MNDFGLIETIRVIDGAVPLWALHVDRLTRSAAALSIALPELTPPAGGPDRIVRIELASGRLELSEREVGPIEPIALVISPAPHRGYPHKTTDRAWLEAARTTASAFGSDDAVLLDADGAVVEATRWALAWWDRETLCFAPLSLGGLPSVARARVSEVVRRGVREERIDASRLGGRSLLACNAARGIVPVAALDGAPLPENHRTAALAGRFWGRRSA